MKISMPEKVRWSQFLLKMGLAVRQAVMNKLATTRLGLADAVAKGKDDVVYGIDRVADEAMRKFLAEESGSVPPFALIAEGYDDGHTVIGDGTPDFQVLIDPIDGTRGIMFDKRAAFFLGAVAPANGAETSLLDTIVSVVVELPTSKHGWADQFVAVEGRALAAERVRLDGGGTRQLMIRPSTAPDLHDGFGQVSDFFPGTKVLAAELMERIATAVEGPVETGGAKIFSEQFISTGGQFCELMLHDRFCCDLRPLFFQIMQIRGVPVAHGLCCHPYDCAGALVAKQAGVILTDGFGAELNPRFNVTDPVHWVGYANSVLQSKIEPIIHGFLKDNGVLGS